MALNFDGRGLPECCGIGLVPGEPHTECQRCHARYNTDLLAQRMDRVRRGEVGEIPADFAAIQTPNGRGNQGGNGLSSRRHALPR